MELFERYIIACEAKTRNMAEDNKYRLIVEYVRKSFESKKAKGIGGAFSTSCKVAYRLEKMMYYGVPWNASGSITYSRRPFE